MSARRSWGFAIDYDREIEQDQAEIERCDRVLATGLAPFAGMQTADPWDLAWDPTVAARMGLTPEDRAALGAYCDWSKAHPSEPDLPEPSGNWYSRGERICRWLEAAYGTHIDGKERSRRAKAVAARGRHRRNRERFSGRAA